MAFIYYDIRPIIYPRYIYDGFIDCVNILNQYVNQIIIHVIFSNYKK